MGTYDGLLAETRPGGRLGNLRKVSSDVARKLRFTYVGMPEDFLSFLEEIGSGEIGSSAYVIYNGVLSPDEIYDSDTAGQLSGVLVFGDDMQGYCFGFDCEHGWVVVEIDPTDTSYRRTFDNFSAFIRDKLREVA